MRFVRFWISASPQQAAGCGEAWVTSLSLHRAKMEEEDFVWPNGCPIWEPHVSEEEEIKMAGTTGRPRNRTPVRRRRTLFLQNSNPMKEAPGAKTEENERKKKGCQIASTPWHKQTAWSKQREIAFKFYRVFALKLLANLNAFWGCGKLSAQILLGVCPQAICKFERMLGLREIALKCW